jgi:hypothetical protein
MVMPFATNGGNGNSGINIGTSGLVSLSFFDQNKNEISIKNTQKSINVTINHNSDQSPSNFSYINASNLTSTLNYVPSGLNLHGSNVSLHIHIKPDNSTSSYLAMLKFGKLVTYNSTYCDADLWEIICPNG